MEKKNSGHKSNILKNGFHLYKKKITILKYYKLLSQLPPSIPLSGEEPTCHQCICLHNSFVVLQKASPEAKLIPESTGAPAAVLILPSKRTRIQNEISVHELCLTACVSKYAFIWLVGCPEFTTLLYIT